MTRDEKIEEGLDFIRHTAKNAPDNLPFVVVKLACDYVGANHEAYVERLIKEAIGAALSRASASGGKCGTCGGAGSIEGNFDERGGGYQERECPACGGATAPTAATDEGREEDALRSAKMRVALECEEAYSHARSSNDWMATLTDAGWDGKSNPRPFINALRRDALRARLGQRNDQGNTPPSGAAHDSKGRGA